MEFLLVSFIVLFVCVRSMVRLCLGSYYATSSAPVLDARSVDSSFEFVPVHGRSSRLIRIAGIPARW